VSSPRLEYLTPRQVAGLLQVSEKTVHRWASSDPTMPAFRRGRVLRFERGRLEAWLDGQGRRRGARVAGCPPSARPESATRMTVSQPDAAPRPGAR